MVGVMSLELREEAREGKEAEVAAVSVWDLKSWDESAHLYRGCGQRVRMEPQASLHLSQEFEQREAAGRGDQRGGERMESGWHRGQGPKSITINSAPRSSK